MPIHIPGARDARGKRKRSVKRNVVAILSLTAMVDLFTVLAVFLIQNYATTGQVIYIPEGVSLPDARETKELKPSNIISISEKGLKLNELLITDFRTVKEQSDWIVGRLKEGIEQIIANGEKEKISLRNRIRDAMQGQDEEAPAGAEAGVDRFRKVTIQADKRVDFLTVKKIMYTVTEAGIYEINFAVLQKEKDDI